MKKSKKLLALLMAVVIIATVIPITGFVAQATNVVSEDFEYDVLSTSDKSCAITGYKGSATEIYIPSEIDGYTVTSIGFEAFVNCSTITSITIPDKVSYIGRYAFFGCSSLINIIIPDSVTTIEYYAFGGCKSLKSIIVPRGVTKIEDEVFHGCYSLTSITIHDGVTNIGDNAFYNCTSLTSISIPDSVINIGNNAFSCCSSLTNVTIPNSVTNIGDDAFYHCTSLKAISVDDSNKYYCDVDGVLLNKEKTEIIRYPLGKEETNYAIPDSVTSIGDFEFRDCKFLTNVTIPDSVTSIGNNAFENCNELTSITIPYTVKSIGNWAFSNCSALTNIIIQNGVTSIGCKAFEYCKVINITIPGSVTSIGDSAFSHCERLTNITLPNGITSIENDMFYHCSSLSSVTIPDGVESIGKWAFGDCILLESVTIPCSVTDIGDYAFYNSKSLTDVYYSGSKEQWNKVSIGTDNTLKVATIHYNYDSSSLGEINGTFDDYVTTVGDGAYISEVIINGKSYKVTKEDSKTLFSLNFSDYDRKKGKNVIVTVDKGYIKSFEFDKEFQLGWDNNSFYHLIQSDPMSGFHNINNYSISDDLIKAMLLNLSLSNGELGSILDEMSSPWTGSCYGISSVMGLCYLGYVDVADLTNTSVNSFYNLQKPCVDNRLLNVIQFYQLSQYLKDYGSASTQCIQRAYNFFKYDAPQNILNSYFDSDFYKLLIQAVNEHKTVLLRYGEKSGSAHVIITCGLTQTSENTYEIKLYDMNDMVDFDRLVITNNNGKYTAQMFCYQNPTVDMMNDVVTYMSFMPLDTLARIFPTKQQKLSKKMTARTTTTTNTMYLTVDYSDRFRINFPDGKYISFDGDQFEGNVEIYDVQYLIDSGREFGSSRIKLEIDRYDTFEYIGKERTSITAYDNDKYYSVNGNNIDSVLVDMNNGTEIKGTNFDFESSINKVDNGDVSVIKTTGKAETDVKIYEDENGNIVRESEKGIENLLVKELTEDGSKVIESGETQIPVQNLTLTLNGQPLDTDVAYVKLPKVGMLYKNHSATLGFTIDSSVNVQSVKWSYDGWSVSNPEANIESPDSAETVIRPNGKGVGARSTWVKLTVTDTSGNVYEKTVKVRFYKFDWQKK